MGEAVRLGAEPAAAPGALARGGRRRRDPRRDAAGERRDRRGRRGVGGAATGRPPAPAGHPDGDRDPRLRGRLAAVAGHPGHRDDRRALAGVRVDVPHR
nr:hypothetical protein [Angustibacter aerolatus]